MKRVTEGDDLAKSRRVIGESLATVASDFGLTPANRPTHPAFTAVHALPALRGKGVELFGLRKGDEQIGFIAVEKASEELHYIERLAVLKGWYLAYGFTETGAKRFERLPFAVCFAEKSAG